MSDFQKDVENKTIGLEAAYEKISNHNKIVCSMAACEPRLFFQELEKHAHKWKGLEIYCANPMGQYDCFKAAGLEENLKFKVMFLTPQVRAHQGGNYIHYIPQHLSRWAENIISDKQVDILWASCSLPDKRGFISLGIGACYEPEVLKKAKLVIMEINPKLPFTSGATIFHISDIDYFINSSHDVPTIVSAQPDKVDSEIAEFIAELVPNEATLQLGIGKIPNAVASKLNSHKDLGIHTELINDAMMELYENGAVTCRKKTYFPDKIIGAFALGSKKLYEFVDRNPMVEFLPASIVNDPYKIGRNFKMTSINTAIEIDLTGQVCSESIGHQELSGVGGAMETHLGAQRSAGGRGIICLRSHTQDRLSHKLVSKIVFELKPGAKVSISRNDIDTVVSEFGIARLKGKSVAERANALINIAHPEFKEELLFKAKEARYI